MKHGLWEIDSDFNCLEYFGFLYIIRNKITEQKYVGKKNFRKKNGRDSGWKEYRSSSKYLLKDINDLGDANFEFTIIYLAKNRTELSAAENNFQIQNDVLRSIMLNGNRAWYNRNIRGIKFDTSGVSRTFSESHRTKLSISQTGENNSFYGRHHTEEHRLAHGAKMSQICGADHHAFGKTQSTESNIKRRTTLKSKLSTGLNRPAPNKGIPSPRQGLPRTRSLIIEQKEFKSVVEAASTFKLSTNSVRHRLKSPQFPNWEYAD